MVKYLGRQTQVIFLKITNYPSSLKEIQEEQSYYC